MSEAHQNSRLEAFCDGVFAIALTLLIIDIKIPPGKISSSAELWHALKEITPSIFAFILSFLIILITWVNHHNSLRLINKSSPAFIYANGLMLLSVVFVPFPTSLLGEFLATDHAAPAVVLYNFTLSIQAIAWILLCSAALKNKLAKNDKGRATIKRNGQFGYFAFALYTIFAILAFWFPLIICIITTISWIFWLVWGNIIEQEEV